MNLIRWWIPSLPLNLHTAVRSILPVLLVKNIAVFLFDTVDIVHRADEEGILLTFITSTVEVFTMEGVFYLKIKDFGFAVEVALAATGLGAAATCAEKHQDHHRRQGYIFRCVSHCLEPSE